MSRARVIRCGRSWAELNRGGRAERLELGRLGGRELAELVAGILGEAPAPRLDREILARSEGNPFFAEELLAARREGTRLPPALRDLLLARVDALPEPAQRVLAAAAVVGSRVDHELLAAATGLDEGQLVPLLREAVARHLLAVDEASGGYVFRHALVQEAVYGELLPAQRGPLHAAYARALDRRIAHRDADGGGGTAVELAQLAYHWHAAGDLGQALPAFVRAGRAAELAAAPAEALEHYQRALELWEQASGAAASSPLDQVAVLDRAAQVADYPGRCELAAALGTRALGQIDSAAEPLRAGVLLERLGRYHWHALDSSAAMAAIERAVATVPAKPPTWERAPALAASVLTAEAEWSRVDGPSDPERWASSAGAWEALSYGLTSRERECARAARRGPHRPPDRRGAVHQPQDRRHARVQRPDQARRTQPRRGRRRRAPAPPGRLSGVRSGGGGARRLSG